MKKVKFKKKFYDGIWFYGMSGSGKTFSSKILFKKILNSIIIDGDQVRKYISKDLGRDIASREIQLDRLLGISIIALKSKLFPITSSVYMDNITRKKIEKKNILLFKIERDFNDLKNKKTYKERLNVVGVDLKYPILKTFKLKNDSTKNFKNKILELI